MVWLKPVGLRRDNSAHELASEYLASLPATDPHVVDGWRTVLRLAVRRRAAPPVYAQMSSPGMNLRIAVLVMAGVPVSVHYLDMIHLGYPRWAQWLGPGWLIRWTLRHAPRVIAISPPMKRFLCEGLGRRGRTDVYFRQRPDVSAAVDGPRLGGVAFFGAVNWKTNIDALVEAARRLHARGGDLHVYTRTTDPRLIERLQEAGVTVHAAIPAEQVIETSRLHDHQLLAFNGDRRSRDFYRCSTPSKLPNLLCCGVPILYHGPDDFWILRCLAAASVEVRRLDSPDLAFGTDAAAARLPERTSGSDRLDRFLAEAQRFSG